MEEEVKEKKRKKRRKKLPPLPPPTPKNRVGASKGMTKAQVIALLERIPEDEVLEEDVILPFGKRISPHWSSPFAGAREEGSKAWSPFPPAATDDGGDISLIETEETEH